VKFSFAFLSFATFAWQLSAATFLPPTANRALFQLDSQSKYFVGTTGKPWESGTFGCVRSAGWQMHEGLDVRCLQRDKKGEPIDPVFATADGKVAYISNHPGLSNYGNYIVVQHVIDGLEIYSLYAHLSEIRSGLRVGRSVRAGENIATMGRTTNTRERISQEHAHVHFELNFFITERFNLWYKQNYGKQKNDHGLWNGQNMIGVDPRDVLLVSNRKGESFNLLNWVQNQRELCRVQVRKTNFPWLKRYAALIRRNPVAEKEGIAGYELALSFNGLPFQVIPRAASEMKSKSKYQLLSVNPAAYNECPCRKLVTRSGKSWELASNGIRLLDLLTY
jgi:murein DD-endopeptidase MepM/ murein hydrolase activator NlpD